ncbi:hypothetical protein AN639_02790 [Candidatus Epulonipiscium fishelsonii]|uniref:Uncharacterized protein n=1 Tax=Candidatus Epulonipiscium fishelsonii TaxID=77094 RepID=A0ACC8X9M5_9FIRM|nr:hypothetical protein AN396_10145 [Epulopiscium sp. SCG-B11WGA-EpuloA1]ONI41869.1 hypothetical protein AN639_02790 [Epulopiscium sp. SCG-B05WGA-EpuloA1]
MKKKLLFLLVGAMALTGCGGASGGDSEGDTFKLKLGHIQPAEHPVGKSAEEFARLVKEKTNGNVEVAIFPASQLGTEKEIFDSVDIGSIDLAMLGYGEPAKKFTNIGIFDAPYLAKDREHMTRLLSSNELDVIFEDMTQYMNVKGLGGFYYGARYLTTNEAEVRTPEDIKGLNIRVPDQKMYIDTLASMGASATPMSFSEVYLSLQQGVIDGQENPLATISANKFNEVQKYLIKTDHIIGTQALYVSTKTLDKLPAEYIEAIESAADETMTFANELAFTYEDEQMKVLLDAGMILIDDVDKEAFQASVADVYADFDEEFINKFRSIE